MRQLASMRQTTYTSTPTIIIDVSLSTEPDSHAFYGRVDVYPLGHPPSRYAHAGECIIRLQDRFLGAWRTIEQRDSLPWGPVAPPPNDYLGNHFMIRTPRLNPGLYRITAQHKESGAEYGREFTVNSDFSVSGWSSRIKINEGSKMPPTFRQFKHDPGRPARGLAIPETRVWPITGKPGMPGVRIAVRQHGGYVSREPIV